MEIYEYKGLKFYVRPKSDKFIVHEVLDDNVKFFDYSKLSEIKTIIDIGAHIGTFSIFSSFRVGKVFSFEPFIDNYNQLIKNIELNNVKNIEAFNMAVSDSTSDRMFYRSEETNARHTIIEPPFLSVYLNQKEFAKVHSTTLERIIRDNQINDDCLLKLDCEGGEYSIILNSPDYVFENIKYILMEIHADSNYPYNHTHIIKKLERLGYRIDCREYFRENEFVCHNLVASK